MHEFACIVFYGCSDTYEYVSRTLKFTVGRKRRMQIKREIVYSQIKEIVPLGVSLIDEEQISRVQLTRQAEWGRHISQD